MEEINDVASSFLKEVDKILNSRNTDIASELTKLLDQIDSDLSKISAEKRAIVKQLINESIVEIKRYVNKQDDKVRNGIQIAVKRNLSQAEEQEDIDDQKKHVNSLEVNMTSSKNDGKIDSEHVRSYILEALYHKIDINLDPGDISSATGREDIFATLTRASKIISEAGDLDVIKLAVKRNINLFLEKLNEYSRASDSKLEEAIKDFCDKLKMQVKEAEIDSSEHKEERIDGEEPTGNRFGLKKGATSELSVEVPEQEEGMEVGKETMGTSVEVPEQRPENTREFSIKASDIFPGEETGIDVPEEREGTTGKRLDPIDIFPREEAGVEVPEEREGTTGKRLDPIDIFPREEAGVEVPEEREGTTGKRLDSSDIFPGEEAGVEVPEEREGTAGETLDASNRVVEVPEEGYGIDDNNSELARLKAELEKERVARENAERENAELKKSNAELNSELVVRIDENGSLRASLKERKEQIAGLTHDLEVMKGENTTLRGINDNLREKSSNSQEQYENAATIVIGLSGEVTRLTDELNDAKKQIAGTKADAEKQVAEAKAETRATVAKSKEFFNFVMKLVNELSNSKNPLHRKTGIELSEKIGEFEH
ncbi:MAG: hypothetical protein IJS47_01300 [Clostridia bacterium]|nr:hypothetical protein [Clostridia bacterium]